jgi:16S rRNA (cytosine967-C5)-methyltransferase
MTGSIIDLACLVIRGSDRQHPADSELRKKLKNARGLSRNDAADVSHAVFAYYRWLGWMEDAAALEQKIAAAIELDAKFRTNQGSFADEELMRHAIPAWVGPEVEMTAEFARALQRSPKLWLRARRGNGPELAERLGAATCFGDGPLEDAVEYCGDEDLFRTPEFHNGEFELQDISSQAVGFVCAPQPGETWWDCCAGEGGKTLHLSALMENKGLIWATDIAEWRLQNLKRRTSRARAFNYRARVWDGSAHLPTKTKFDGVLLDAPCSGIGTWQRNPHARWTLTSDDVRELAELQLQLLKNASAAVKPGGRLIYAVCTLAESETSEVVRQFEASAGNFGRIEIPNPLQPGSSAARELRLKPQDFGGNGMFIAAWRSG